MVTSFLKPETVDKIHAIQARGFATKLALGPDVDIILSRFSDATGLVTTLPPHRVLIEYAKRVPATEGGVADLSMTQGTFSAFAPWDVKTGDEFSLPNAQGGRIDEVPLPVGGVQRASFTITTGGA